MREEDLPLMFARKSLRRSVPSIRVTSRVLGLGNEFRHLAILSSCTATGMDRTEAHEPSSIWVAAVRACETRAGPS